MTYTIMTYTIFGEPGKSLDERADDVFVPLGAMLEAFRIVVGGTAGLLQWLDYAEWQIERNPEQCALRIARCAYRNQQIREHGFPGLD